MPHILRATPPVRHVILRLATCAYISRETYSSRPSSCIGQMLMHMLVLLLEAAALALVLLVVLVVLVMLVLLLL